MFPFDFSTLPYILLTAAVIVAVFAILPFLARQGSLDSFKSRPVGDGQHGTARWATSKEIHDAYLPVPFLPQQWRRNRQLPENRGWLSVLRCGGKRPPPSSILQMCTV